MIFKLGLTNTGYGSSTFVLYHERRDNEFGLDIGMEDDVELDSTHLGGTEKTV